MTKQDYVLVKEGVVVYPIRFMSRTAAQRAAKAVNRASGWRALTAVKYETAYRRRRYVGI